MFSICGMPQQLQAGCELANANKTFPLALSVALTLPLFRMLFLFQDSDVLVTSSNKSNTDRVKHFEGVV